MSPKVPASVVWSRFFPPSMLAEMLADGRWAEATRPASAASGGTCPTVASLIEPPRSDATSSPQWLITFTAILPVSGGANGRLYVRYSANQAS